MNRVQNKNRTSISHLLKKIVKRHEDNASLTYGELVQTFGDQAFGLIIILFALPSALPMSIIPGFSFLFSLPIVFVAIHIIIARRALWLPSQLSNQSLDFKKFVQVVNKTVPYLSYIEQLLRPRWLIFSSPAMERLHGVIMLGLSLLLLLPIPFSNFIFASLIILFGLGLAEKDGVVLAVAYLGASTYVFFLIKMTRGLLTMLFA